MLGEPRNQFSLTRAALSTLAGEKAISITLIKIGAKVVRHSRMIVIDQNFSHR